MMNRQKLQLFRLFSTPYPNKPGNILWILPEDIKGVIEESDFTDSQITEVLQDIVQNKERNVLDKLEKNRELITEVHHVISRSGLKVLRVTPFECAIGEGNPQLAMKMIPYFAKLPDGRQKIQEQFANYSDSIEKLKTLLVLVQKLEFIPYDFEPLLKAFDESSIEDVLAELEHNLSHQSNLKKALQKFRNDMKPGIQEQSGLHCNYLLQLYVHLVYEQQFERLRSPDSIKKILFWRQVVGYVQRNFMQVDREDYDKGLKFTYLYRAKYANFTVSEAMKNDLGYVAAKNDTNKNTSLLGFDHALSIHGVQADSNNRYDNPGLVMYKTAVKDLIIMHIEDKLDQYTKLEMRIKIFVNSDKNNSQKTEECLSGKLKFS